MWKKGQSGNPGGKCKPENDLSAQIARAAFAHDPEGIKRAVLRALKKGNPKMFMALADRGFGRLPLAVDLDLNATLHNLSDKELEVKLAAALAALKGKE